MIADSPDWKYPESQERRLLSGKPVVSVVYERGIFGEREIQVGLERDVGFPLSIKKKIERVRKLRRAGSVLNQEPHLLFLTYGSLWEGQVFWLRLEDKSGPIGMPRIKIILWGSVTILSGQGSGPEAQHSPTRAWGPAHWLEGWLSNLESVFSLVRSLPFFLSSFCCVFFCHMTLTRQLAMKHPHLPGLD